MASLAAPVSVHLTSGWNLIGNATAVAVRIPAGFIAFTYDGVGYQSTAVLQPGEGAWVKTVSEQDIELAPTG